ncbi:MAG: hypothetical protein HQL52_17445 [Magnetococcales bacterium]|nr:hypothetical protein [Magnetococcales bacterium]
MDDFYAAEPLIVTRLKGQVSALKSVAGARDLDGAAEMSRPAPAAYVIPSGEAIRSANEGEATLEQYWVVVIAVRNARDLQSGEAERREVGPIKAAVISALLGWKPGKGFTPLSIAQAPPPIPLDGVGFYPVRFSTRITVRGVG